MVRVLRCLECGFLDASVPTVASQGDICKNCNGDDTEPLNLKTL